MYLVTAMALSQLCTGLSYPAHSCTAMDHCSNFAIDEFVNTIILFSSKFPLHIYTIPNNSYSKSKKLLLNPQPRYLIGRNSAQIRLSHPPPQNVEYPECNIRCMEFLCDIQKEMQIETVSPYRPGTCVAVDVHQIGV